MSLEREKNSIEEICEIEKISHLRYVFRYLKNWLLGGLASKFPVPTMRVHLYRMQGINIGNKVYIGYEVIFDRIHPGSIFIGDNVGIGDRCIITAHQHVPALLQEKYPRTVNPVHIEQGVNIFPGCIINNGVTIGERSVVGTGSVVLWNVPPNSVVQGNPAKIIRKLEFDQDKTNSF